MAWVSIISVAVNSTGMEKFPLQDLYPRPARIVPSSERTMGVGRCRSAPKKLLLQDLYPSTMAAVIPYAFCAMAAGLITAHERAGPSRG
jgi:hypothetical protein